MQKFDLPWFSVLQQMIAKTDTDLVFFIFLFKPALFYIQY